MSTEPAEAPPDKRSVPLPVTQVLWLALLHWPSTVVGVLLCLSLIGSDFQTSDRQLDLSAIAFLCAGVSSALGSLMATKICLGRVSNVEFDRGTTTSRVIAVAILALPLSIVGSVLIGDIIHGTLSDGSDMVTEMAKDLIRSSVLPVIGVGAVLATIGPGFSEYREARAKCLRRSKRGE